MVQNFDQSIYIQGSDPNWAVHTTLKQIQEHLKNIADASNVDKKKTEEVEKKTVGFLNVFSGSLRKSSKEIDSAGKILSSRLFGLSDTMSKMSRGWSHTTNKLGEILRLDQTNSSFQSLSAVVFGFSATMTAVAGAVDATADTYRGMVDVGQRFNGSLYDMVNLANTTSMSLSSFERLITSSSKAAKVFGADTMALTSDIARRSLMPFGQLGLKIDEINDFLGEYLESQRMLGMGSRLTAEQQAMAFSRLLRETTAMADLTGTSRKELMRQRIATMTETESRIAQADLLNRVGESGVEAYQRGLSALGPLEDALRETVVQATSGYGAINTEMGRSLAVMAPEVLNMIEEIGAANRAGDAERAMELGFAVQNILKDKINDPSFTESLRAFGLSGQAEIASFAKAVHELIDPIRGLNEVNQQTLQSALDAQDQQTSFTNIAANSEQILNVATAHVKESLLNFGNETTDAFSGPDGIVTKLKNITNDFMSVDSKRVAELMEEGLSEREAFAKLHKEGRDSFFKEAFGDFGVGAGTSITDALGKLDDLSVSAAKAAASFETMANALSVLTDKIGYVGTALLAIFGGKKLLGLGAMGLFKGLKSLIGGGTRVLKSVTGLGAAGTTAAQGTGVAAAMGKNIGTGIAKETLGKQIAGIAAKRGAGALAANLLPPGIGQAASVGMMAWGAWEIGSLIKDYLLQSDTATPTTPEMPEIEMPEIDQIDHVRHYQEMNSVMRKTNEILEQISAKLAMINGNGIEEVRRLTEMQSALTDQARILSTINR